MEGEEGGGGREREREREREYGRGKEGGCSRPLIDFIFSNDLAIRKQLIYYISMAVNQPTNQPNTVTHTSDQSGRIAVDTRDSDTHWQLLPPTVLPR